VSLCSTCGWWKAIEDYECNPIYSSHDPGPLRELTLARRAGVAVLREFDLSDLTLPLHEVRQFLLAKFSQRFTMHPRLFEMTVASVFESAGFDVVLTAYTKDGGIDVILQGTEGTVGVQVKRWRNSVDVDQIRALAGALLQHGHTRGVFVTTSKFQSGVKRTVAQLASRGYPIELIDAPRLFDALKIGLRPAYSTVEEMRSSGLLRTLQSLYSRTAR
jgi:restriction system protein